MKKKFCLLMVAVLLICLVGCNSEQNRASKKYEASVNSSIETQSIAQNEKIELLWEDKAKAVQIKNFETGKIWSNIPYEYYLSEGTSSKVNSTINITVSKNDNLAVETVRGYDAVTDIQCEKLKNGIKITYFFDDYSISVPIQYILKDDHLEMSIDVNNICEGDDYKIVAVDIDPYLCSVNNEVEDSYLFIPVGSGALMYPTEDVDKTRNFVGEVYGIDATAIVEEYLNDNTPIRLPVFGVKDSNNALFCIIDDADGAATLNAESGNSRTGYSNVYATFNLRGYDIFPITTTTAYLGGTQYKIYSDNIIEQSPKVLYYPLINDEANYVGMANCYRDFLKNNNSLSNSVSKQPTFDLNIVGGAEITTTTLGIPHSTTEVLTDFKSALTIISDLNNISQMKPSIRLTGYGDSGFVPGKIAGGYKFLKSYGTKKEREQIQKYCQDNGLPLFYDFDLVRFSSSGKGFSKLSDSAMTASLRTAQNSFSVLPTRENGSEKYNLLKRSKIIKATTLLDEFMSKNNLSGVSILSFGELAYSDYSESQFEMRGNLKQQSKEIFELFSKSKRNTATGSNLYAAVNASSINNVPIDNGGYFALSESIPFYQMVFCGVKPLYAVSANQVENIDKYLIDCISSGTYLSFSLIDNYSPRFSEKDNNYVGMGPTKLFALKYESNEEMISDILIKYSDIYSKINGSFIKDYIILENGVTKTIFSNGLEIYANHTNTNVETAIGVLGPYNFKTVS